MGEPLPPVREPFLQAYLILNDTCIDAVGFGLGFWFSRLRPNL